MSMIVKHIAICITNKCNMNCQYCFRNGIDFSNKPLNFDYWNELLTFLNTNRDIEIADNLDIIFTGGEPFTNIDNVLNGYHTLSKLARYKETSIRFGIVTNLCDPKKLLEMVDKGYLDKNNVSISWDGDSNATVLSELIYNEYNSQHYDLFIRIAITENGIKDLYNNLLHLRSLGFTNVEYYFVNGSNEYNKEVFIDEFRNQLKLIIDDDSVLEILNNYKKIKSAIKEPYCMKMGKLLYIDTDGWIWPCGFYSEDSNVHAIENIRQYKLGTIFDGFLPHKLINPKSNVLPLDHFCHACSEECIQSIRRLKQIELEVYER